jgi:hypothetical protein
MKRSFGRGILYVIVVLCTAALLAACAHGGAETKGGGGAPGQSAIYWCGSATDGPCSGISKTPSTCPDGKPMNAGHIVWMEGSTAYVCPCGDTCDCKIDPKDHSKCGCGKKIRKIDLAGSGLYICDCLGNCRCNTVSDKPGKCSCGMPLRQLK